MHDQYNKNMITITNNGQTDITFKSTDIAT